jgi:hypothetical protein
MKKLILILSLALTLSASADSLMIIHEIREVLNPKTAPDVSVLVGYRVETFNAKNGAPISTKYTVQEAQDIVFKKLLQGAAVGTSKNPQRIIAWFKPDGTVRSVDFQVIDKDDKLETVQKTEADLPADVATDLSTAKVDVETKTGKDLSGGDVKPKDPIKDVDPALDADPALKP